MPAVDVDAPTAEAAALRDDHAVRAAVGHLELGRDGERLVLDAHDARLGESAHSGEEQLAVPADQGRPPGDVGIEPFRGAVVDRQHVVLHGLDQPEPLQFMQPIGLLGREVPRLAVVDVAVVELPDVVVERRHDAADHHPRGAVLRDGAPPLEVDAAVAEHLEVLQVVTLRGIRFSEAVEHARCPPSATAARR